MSDGDALLNAIYANPDENTPRLVYADWLEENGDAEHAAFIRVQVQRSIYPLSVELEGREIDLWFAVRDRLCMNLPGIARGIYATAENARPRSAAQGQANGGRDSWWYEFRRGFPEVNGVMVGRIVPGLLLWSNSQGQLTVKPQKSGRSVRTHHATVLRLESNGAMLIRPQATWFGPVDLMAWIYNIHSH